MSIVQLLNVNFLNNDYNHTIDFVDEETQIAFFDNYVKLTQELPTTDDYVYVRENRFIDVGANKGTLNGVNYLRFNNGNKWWYAFITSKDYLNEDATRIHFEIDVMQTFMFDYTLKESFISRQHEDRMFLHNSKLYPIYNLEDENINIGDDYVLHRKDKLYENEITDQSSDILWAEIICTESMTTGSGVGDVVHTSLPLKSNGLASGLFVYLIPFKKELQVLASDGTWGTTNIEILDYLITSESVQSIVILPYCPIKYTATSSTPPKVLFNGSYTEGNYPADTTALVNLSCNVVIANKSNFGGVNLAGMVDHSGTHITPYVINLINYNESYYNTFVEDDITILPYVNSDHLSVGASKIQDPKLDTFPYRYTAITDNRSQPFVVKNQNKGMNRAFLQDNKKNLVKLVQSVGINQKLKCYVTNYLGDSQGKKDNLINNDICEMAIINDAYTDYISRHKASATTGFALNLGTDIITNAVRTGVGLEMGNPFAISNAISGVSSTFKNIANEVIKFKDLETQPGNIRKYGNNAEFDVNDNNMKIWLYQYKIKDSFMQKVAEYFYRYGYSFKGFATPDVRSRYYFNYIQSPDMCLDTGIDNEYINKIKSIFRDGITIWHYRDENTWNGIENYQYDNAEMSLLE